jgi:hypothetical protein
MMISCLPSRRIGMSDLMRNQLLLSGNHHADMLFLLHQICQSKKNIVEDATIKQTTVVKNRSEKKTKDRRTRVGDNDN